MTEEQKEKPLDRFYKLYKQGRKNEKAPQSYIDYFKASKFLLDEIDYALAKQREEIGLDIVELKYSTVKIERKGKLCEKESWGARTGFNLAISEVLNLLK